MLVGLREGGVTIDLDRRGGHTLLEMVAAMVILGIVAAMAARMVVASLEAWTTGRLLAPLAAKGWLAMDAMIRELRFSRAFLTTSGPGWVLRYNNLADQSVTLSQVDFDGNPAGAIYREVEGGGKQLLTGQVQPGSFKPEVPVEGKVSLAFTMEESRPGTPEPLLFPLWTLVHVRNP